MFLKTGHLHLTYLFAIIVMVRVLISQSRSPRFKTTEWLQDKLHPFILLKLIKRVPGTPGD